MKEKENNGLIIFVILLAILVLGLGGFIVYDKVLIGINNTEQKTGNEEDNTEQQENEESCKSISKICIKDYDTSYKYKTVILNNQSQCRTSVIFNRATEILRTPGPLCMISAQETVYFVNELDCRTEEYGKLRIYNKDLKYITAKAYLAGNTDTISFDNTYYFEPYVEGRVWVTDFDEVYEYDHDFVLKAKLSDKISLVIKNYKILGIADKYAFLVDKEGYLYAVDLHNYGVEKSNSIPKNKVTNSDNTGRYLRYFKCDGDPTIHIYTSNNKYVKYIASSGFNF